MHDILDHKGAAMLEDTLLPVTEPYAMKDNLAGCCLDFIFQIFDLSHELFGKEGAEPREVRDDAQYDESDEKRSPDRPA